MLDLTQNVYDQAMKNLIGSLRIDDPDLLYGAVEMLTHTSERGTYKRPYCRSGTFASVYKVLSASGKWLALRCYRSQCGEDLQERYHHLDHIRRCFPALSRYLVECTYYKEGLQIPQAGTLVYVPLLVMEWVEGKTLAERVDELCNVGDRTGLGELAQEWFAFLAICTEVQFAHGDYSADNVYFDKDNKLRLIDLDAVSLPTLSLGQGDLLSATPGQQDFQHFDMQNRPYGARMDDFSAYVIGCALLALEHSPSLWNEYTLKDKAGRLLTTNLLFTKKDFEDPEYSKLFTRLRLLDNPLLHFLTEELIKACKADVRELQLPLLYDTFQKLVCPGENVVSQKQCDRLLSLALLRESVKRQQPARQIVSFSLQFDALARQPLMEAQIHETVIDAKRQLLAQWTAEPIDVKVDQPNNIIVTWQWPEDPLAQYVAVAWNYQAGCALGEDKTYLSNPIVRQQSGLGTFQFQLRQSCSSIHIMVCLALPVRQRDGNLHWLYSQGTSITKERAIQPLREAQGHSGAVYGVKHYHC